MPPHITVWLNRVSASLAVIVVAGATRYVASEQPWLQPSAIAHEFNAVQPLGAIRSLLSRHR
jgi:hypothetical protein